MLSSVTARSADVGTAAMRDLAAAVVRARYFEFDSELGLSASGPEHAKWSSELPELLAPSTAGSR